MTMLYKKGNQNRSRFGDVIYDYDIITSKDDEEIAELLKGEWVKTLPETVKSTSKAKK